MGTGLEMPLHLWAGRPDRDRRRGRGRMASRRRGHSRPGRRTPRICVLGRVRPVGGCRSRGRGVHAGIAALDTVAPSRHCAAALTVAAVVSVLMGGLVYGAAATHSHFWGATHPTSATPAPDMESVEWLWVGAVTDDSAEVGRGRQTSSGWPSTGDVQLQHHWPVEALLELSATSDLVVLGRQTHRTKSSGQPHEAERASREIVDHRAIGVAHGAVPNRAAAGRFTPGPWPLLGPPVPQIPCRHLE